MRVLLDECVPRIVKKHLPGHQVSTVQEMGWGGIKNGNLLSAAEGHFDIFITTDKNLRYQQNLKRYSFAVLLLPTNRRRAVVGLLPAINAALESSKVGDFVEIQSS